MATGLRDRIALEWSWLDRVVQAAGRCVRLRPEHRDTGSLRRRRASSAYARLNDVAGADRPGPSAALVRLADIPTIDFDLAGQLPGLAAIGDRAAALTPDLLARLGDAWGLADALALGLPIWEDRVWPPPELAPGTPEGDFLLIQRTDGDPDERLAAMKRVATANA